MRVVFTRKKRKKQATASEAIRCTTVVLAGINATAIIIVIYEVHIVFHYIIDVDVGHTELLFMNPRSYFCDEYMEVNFIKSIVPQISVEGRPHSLCILFCRQKGSVEAFTHQHY